jgi:hypothetical protein
VSKNSKKFKSSTIMFIAASIVALIGIALLVDNVILYQMNIAQYVAQGYPINLILEQLVPAQLLPGIFEPIGIYGGIASVLYSAGFINKKVTDILAKIEFDYIDNEDKNLANNEAKVGDTETPESEAHSQETDDATGNA